MSVSTAERVQKHRQSLRASGLRPIQIWVPDTRNPKFAEECLRQSQLLKEDSHEEEIMMFLESVADKDGWR